MKPDQKWYFTWLLSTNRPRLLRPCEDVRNKPAGHRQRSENGSPSSLRTYVRDYHQRQVLENVEKRQVHVMKIAITGSKGMLGTEAASFFAGRGEDVTRITRETADITNQQALFAVLERQRPTALIHCAAMTNVDACESDPNAAYLNNTVGTWNCALAAKHFDCLLVYISTCGLFNGSKLLPYTEYDQPDPLTHYAKSKYYAEETVKSLCPQHYIVRTGWLYGGSAQHSKNFVEARRKEASQKETIGSACDKFGSPTYTLDVVKQIAVLLESGAFGLYHAVNPGFVSRFEYVRQIVSLLGIKCSVQPVTSHHFQRGAPVPSCEVLDNLNLRLRGLEIMRPWKTALGSYVATNYGVK